MGAWIEIAKTVLCESGIMSHPTMGAWIEIKRQMETKKSGFCRTPRWVRGLKLLFRAKMMPCVRSHPTMGAWIEIKDGKECIVGHEGRTPRWVRGLKLENSLDDYLGKIYVAPHDGCVD